MFSRKDKNSKAQFVDAKIPYNEIEAGSLREINRSILGAWDRVRRTRADEWRDGEGFENVGIWGNSVE